MDIVKANTEIREQRRSVGFDSYDITVKQLTDMVSERQIHIDPAYQRHFVWDAKRQSVLIESLLLGIPVPSLFMATNEDSTWEVIDGLQRVTTLMNFTFGDAVRSHGRFTELRLQDLEKIPSLNGAKFSDLTGPMQLNFMTRPVRITVLNDRSDFQVRFDLFERLNTGGIILHEQEIRNCVYQGPFNDMIRELATDPRVLNAIRRTDKSTRGNIEELVLKFFAYYEDRELFVHSVKGFLNDFMEKKAKYPGNILHYLDLFDKTFEVIHGALPNGIVRQDRPNTTPLALFECVTVAVADAITARQDINPDRLRSVLDNAELKRLMTGATNSKPRLLARINLVKSSITA